MRVSNHAKKRFSQRGIPSNVNDLVLAFGTPTHLRGRNALSYKLTKKNMAQARSFLGGLLNDLENFQGRTIITNEASSTIITVY
ncbi:MAG: hypothetical protein GX043_11185 [Desulfovibrionales bacterium]|jgi:hypothetical protein|nr:hypothetical protein [Desulfovibrionales bacterium]